MVVRATLMVSTVFPFYLSSPSARTALRPINGEISRLYHSRHCYFLNYNEMIIDLHTVVRNNALEIPYTIHPVPPPPMVTSRITVIQSQEHGIIDVVLA